MVLIRMDMYLSLDLRKQWNVTIDDFWVLEAQRNADHFLWPEELAPLAGVTVEQALSSSKKITEVMMLSKTFR